MPLLHILAPQLAKKAEQLEADLGHRPEQIGYLQAGAPPAPKETASARGLKELRAPVKKSLSGIVKQGVIDEKARKMRTDIRDKGTRLLPNATPQPAPQYAPRRGGITVAPGDPIGMQEGGKPIYATEAAPQPVKKGKRTIMQLPQGAVGQNEAGQSLAAGGRNLGYLQQDPKVRTLDRRARDVGLRGDMNTYDQFGVKMLQQRFGEHLKAMQDNRDADGLPTDKFPDGYFRGLDVNRKEEIELGVKRLQELERGQAI